VKLASRLEGHRGGPGELVPVMVTLSLPPAGGRKVVIVGPLPTVNADAAGRGAPGMFTLSGPVGAPRHRRLDPVFEVTVKSATPLKSTAVRRETRALMVTLSRRCGAKLVMVGPLPTVTRRCGSRNPEWSRSAACRGPRRHRRLDRRGRGHREARAQRVEPHRGGAGEARAVDVTLVPAGPLVGAKLVIVARHHRNAALLVAVPAGVSRSAALSWPPLARRLDRRAEVTVKLAQRVEPHRGGAVKFVPLMVTLVPAGRWWVQSS